MKVGKWSTTAANNNTTAPDGWPEGMAPSSVNDAGREMMAAIRTLVANIEYIDLDNTPTYASATTFNLGTADTTNWEVGRRVKLFDATTLYGTINSVSATFVSVRLDSGALTSSLSSAALAVLRNTNNSLPEAAFQGHTNFIVNGNFDVWQRGNSFSAVANFAYTADRFQIEKGGTTATFNVTRNERSATSTNVPSIASAGVMLNSSLCITVSGADAAVATSDYAALTTRIEGYNWRNLAHRPMGLSFEVNTNKSGVYAVALRSSGTSASYVTNYTVSAVGAWQRVFVPIPEAPATGYTWDYSAGTGLFVTWTLMGGTLLQATDSEWTAMNAICTSSQVNFAASASNTWSIANVTLHSGMADVPSEMRRYTDELAACQRYYWRGLPAVAINGNAYTANAVFSWPIAFPQTMRGTPSCTLAISAAAFNVFDSAQTTISQATPDGARLLTIATVAASNCSISFGTGDYIEATAEL
jgi:hypothetical protein